MQSAIGKRQSACRTNRFCNLDGDAHHRLVGWLGLGRQRGLSRLRYPAAVPVGDMRLFGQW